MRKLMILALMAVAAISAAGCQSDAYRQHAYRMMQRSCLVDSYAIEEDIHANILLDNRPTHLSFFIE